MKKITATLIASLFATAAFAQTPATPASSTTAAAHASTDVKTPKAAFVDNKDLKATTQTDGKLVKKVNKAEAAAVAKADKEAKVAAKAAAKADVKGSAETPAGTHGAHVSETAKTK